MLGKRSFSDAEHQGAAGGALPVIVKLLCPVDRSGPVIGKGGENIKQIRQETGARVKLEDIVSGLNERAITIVSPDRPGAPTCAAQDALLQLLARVVEPEKPGGGRIVPEKAEAVVIVDRAFARYIVGRGGANVRQIEQDSGASINSLSQPSPLVAAEEQAMKVSGPYPCVKKALNMILNKIRECLAQGTVPMGVQAQRQQAQAASAASAPNTAPVPSPMGGLNTAGGMQGNMQQGLGLQQQQNMQGPANNMPMNMGTGAAAGLPQIETVYRLLMSDNKCGGLIGKQGENLRRLRVQCNAELHVEPRVGQNDDRLVTVRSLEPAETSVCGAAEALLRCVQHMLTDKDPSPQNAKLPKTVKFVAYQKQLGSVIGVKGATIRQLAAESHARVCVDTNRLPPGIGLPTDEVLLGAASDEHTKYSLPVRPECLPQVEGAPEAVMAATRIIAMLLRGYQVKMQLETKGLSSSTFGSQQQQQQQTPQPAPPPPQPQMQRMQPPGSGMMGMQAGNQQMMTGQGNMGQRVDNGIGLGPGMGGGYAGQQAGGMGSYDQQGIGYGQAQQQQQGFGGMNVGMGGTPQALGRDQQYQQQQGLGLGYQQGPASGASLAGSGQLPLGLQQNMQQGYSDGSNLTGRPMNQPIQRPGAMGQPGMQQQGYGNAPTPTNAPYHTGFKDMSSGQHQQQGGQAGMQSSIGFQQQYGGGGSQGLTGQGLSGLGQGLSGQLGATNMGNISSGWGGQSQQTGFGLGQQSNAPAQPGSLGYTGQQLGGLGSQQQGQYGGGLQGAGDGMGQQRGYNNASLGQGLGAQLGGSLASNLAPGPQPSAYQSFGLQSLQDQQQKQMNQNTTPQARSTAAYATESTYDPLNPSGTGFGNWSVQPLTNALGQSQTSANAGYNQQQSSLQQGGGSLGLSSGLLNNASNHPLPASGGNLGSGLGTGFGPIGPKSQASGMQQQQQQQPYDYSASGMVSQDAGMGGYSTFGQFGNSAATGGNVQQQQQAGGYGGLAGYGSNQQRMGYGP